jgi:hypothetical protein
MNTFTTPSGKSSERPLYCSAYGILLEPSALAILPGMRSPGPTCSASASPAAPAAAPHRRPLLALLAATVLWLPALHLFFQPRLADCRAPTGIPPLAGALAARQLQLWQSPAVREAQTERMRASNAEWDFMGRTFLVLALANIALREPAQAGPCVEVMDRIIDETLRIERERGKYYFLMDYARAGQFRSASGRSLFQDGEIALMLAARRLTAERPDYRPLLARRVEAMVAQMSESRVLSGESYPNECWTFCNTVALASMRLADALDGTDHAAFVQRWIATARQQLTDPTTGLLISSYTLDGEPLDGPEGSSIWVVCHCLALLDPAYGRDQYQRAKRSLARSILGFGYAREWPPSWRGTMDIDSGPVLPVLGISAGSSGTAFVAAAAFEDDRFLLRLLTSLNYGGFPQREGPQLRYAAANMVGDAVLLYALVQGPLWEKAAANVQRPGAASRAAEAPRI